MTFKNEEGGVILPFKDVAFIKESNSNSVLEPSINKLNESS